MRADVATWLARRTYRAAQFSAPHLLEAKRRSGTTTSVVLPALDEERTVGAIVEVIRRAFVEDVPLVDELVVVDSGSSDRTASVAEAAGARVVHVDDVLPGHGHVSGKGEALWKSLFVTSGDVLVFLDSDVQDFDPCFVVGLLGPLLADPTVGYVKGLYDRPLATAEGIVPSGGGRVTELTARPLLGALWPHLAGFVQPLSGEYAGRRRLLERVPFASHYGVEFGLLVDLAELAGIDALAQVDLGVRRHRHQSDAALGRMAGQILQTALARCPSLQVPGDQLVQFVRSGGSVEPVAWEVGIRERPPMDRLPEYRARRGMPAPGRLR
ncbi:glucosyl-3-phosphoglycerate synthase [Geodermatophilus sabuli]|uniref:Glucosyl-3-phosphoglycerate synthase n=1 Tax=Geodermatophilus sabuli TaxID=1564158 RepID=A0A285EHT9_9ACTN|nr:glucosyl-3-phosphoglycerate synthase [Geodermatophilus sabuli]MBB3083932.1 glucosyl-3-phosphoglycerate synthase [Geodermatophilus sabuli]SNX98580.1 glucosyl-3-phosphoglycerate synthase [Geodermatophilus sabuli]